MPDEDKPKTEPTNGGDTPPTATPAGKGAGQPASQKKDEPPIIPTRTFTQAEVDAIMGKTRQESRDRAIAGLLEDAGLKSSDQLTTVVKDYEKQRTDRLSDLEKLQEETNRLTPFEQQTKDQEKQLKQYEKTLKAHIETLMKTLSVPEHVKPLLEQMPNLERLAYLTEHGSAFAAPQTPALNTANKGGGTDKGQSAKDRASKVRLKYGIS